MTLHGATEIAKDAVKGLSATPALLLIVILNAFMLGGIAYAANNAREERRELRQQEDMITKIVTDMCAKHS
jgi:hypothetical protein